MRLFGALRFVERKGMPMSENMTETISKYVASTTFEDLDDFTISRLKVRLLDGIGCIAIGTIAPMCDELFDLLAPYEDAEHGATALFRGKKLAAAEAAFINSFEMRSWDFEAVQCENKGKLCSAGHISGTTVPAALAAAERAGASGKEFITALALGDVAERDGLTVEPDLPFVTAVQGALH